MPGSVAKPRILSIAQPSGLALWLRRGLQIQGLHMITFLLHGSIEVELLLSAAQLFISNMITNTAIQIHAVGMAQFTSAA